jgi:hypothetical protein
MTTTATFYDGNGRAAVCLGTLTGTTDPESLRRTPYGFAVLTATDPFAYADAVADLFDLWAEEDFGTADHPRDGWSPPEQCHADWTYTFQQSRVVITYRPSATVIVPVEPPSPRGTDTAEGERP